MSCGPTQCPPTAIPDPVVQPTWTVPAPSDCGRGGIYYNTPQTYVDSCSLGSPTPPISVTIPAFTYSSEVSQDDANNQAMDAAQTAAETERVANPCETSGGDFLIDELGDFFVDESSNFLTT